MTNPNTGTPVTVPMPEILDGSDRLAAQIADIDDSVDPTELLRVIHRLGTELDHLAAYGQLLWHHLEMVATYLREDIAHAASDGRDIVLDEPQRLRWAEMYSSTLSLLAGERGDSGFGAEQAQWEMQHLS